MNLFGLDIYNGKYGDFLELIKDPTKKTLVFTPNPEILLRVSRDPEFLDILKKADYLTPDANGLYVGQMMQEGKWFFLAGFRTFFQKESLRKQYGELIQGSNLTKDLVDFALISKKNILMIDNYRIETPENDFEIRKKEIQSQWWELFQEKFPGLEISIVCDGERTPEELANLIQKENISYVFSCIGMKTQEQRLIEIFSCLPDSEKVVGLGVGSSFDYLLGLQKRAPILFQKLGLEWLYRLLLDPRRRWKRIYDAVVEFPRVIQKTSHN